jgi:hypothetical protein
MDIEASTAYHDWQGFPGCYFLNACKEPLLEFVNTEFMHGVYDIDEMIRDRRAVYSIVKQVFPGSEIHPTVNLSGICGNDFPT